MDKKLILVTGGAGFIGTRLCERLVRDGHRVISLDNYFTGSKDNHIAGVEYREGHTKDVRKLVLENVDIVYHLGEYPRVAKSIEEPQVVFDLNMLGTAAVLKYWRAAKCRLVYAGSSTKQANVRQDGVAGRDLSPYTWSKAANSDQVINYGRWYGLSYAIVYFYNVYGPGERAGTDQYGTVIETFKQCYLKGESCKINGTGEQTRAFTHVDDTVAGIIAAGEKGQNDEYPISAKEVYSLLDVAKRFDLPIEFLPPTPSTRSTGAEDTANLEALGWRQEHTLMDYIDSIKNEHPRA